ncbi:hypothetical protein DSECCO2_303240 [anaerobic digester metagenome]
MIFYFSATGNNKYLAERIAAATGDDLISIAECVKSGRYGFVTPTYFWGLPSIVCDFLGKLALFFEETPYVYHVLTFGSSTGSAHRDMAKLLAAKGLSLQGRFAVRMVDTWTPMFDCSDAEKNRRDTEAAEPEIDTVIGQIKAKAVGEINRHKGFSLISSMVQKEYEGKRATKYFSVQESCVGCGLCAKQCPMEAITMQNGKPTWTKEKCALCLGCLHRCPKFAIQYAGKTEGRGQFVNPNTTL